MAPPRPSRYHSRKRTASQNRAPTTICAGSVRPTAACAPGPTRLAAVGLRAVGGRRSGCLATRPRWTTAACPPLIPIIRTLIPILSTRTIIRTRKRLACPPRRPLCNQCAVQRCNARRAQAAQIVWVRAPCNEPTLNSQCPRPKSPSHSPLGGPTRPAYEAGRNRIHSGCVFRRGAECIRCVGPVARCRSATCRTNRRKSHMRFACVWFMGRALMS
jgi:hypothetical protein